MPMKTVASLIIIVAPAQWVRITMIDGLNRLVSLETSRELFENDLLKKWPVDNWKCP